MGTLVGNESYIENVLRELGFQKIRRTNRNFLALCKFHDDHNPSFSMGDNGKWHCFSCGEKGNLKSLHDKLGVSGFDWKQSLKMLGMQFDDLPQRKKKRTVAALPFDFKAYQIEAQVPMCVSKRLKWETIQSFGLGVCRRYPNAGRCVIPVAYKGKVVGYHGRAVLSDVTPKYWNPSDFEMKRYVFNFDGCKDGEELFIVEGAFNAMSMVEKGFTNTIATFGTQFGAEQLARIFDLHPSSIVICFDRDPSKIKNGKEIGRSGQRATMQLGALLDDILTTWVMPLPEGQDPNNLSAAEIQKCYEGRVRYDRLRRRNV